MSIIYYFIYDDRFQKSGQICTGWSWNWNIQNTLKLWFNRLKRETSVRSGSYQYVRLGKIHRAMSFVWYLQSDHIPTSGQISKLRLVSVSVLFSKVSGSAISVKLSVLKSPTVGQRSSAHAHGQRCIGKLYTHISPASGRKAYHVKYDSAISRHSLTQRCEGNSDEHTQLTKCSRLWATNCRDAEMRVQRFEKTTLV